MRMVASRREVGAAGGLGKVAQWVPQARAAREQSALRVRVQRPLLLVFELSAVVRCGQLSHVLATYVCKV